MTAALLIIVFTIGMLQSAPAQEPESSNQKAFASAQQLYNDGKTAEALASFQQCESQNKFSTTVPQTIYFEGWCQIGLHKYQDAIDTFDRLIKTYPTLPIIPEVILKEAECYRELKNCPMALNLYHQFETQYPKHTMMPQAMLGEASALFDSGQLPVALDHFQKFAVANRDPQLLEIADFHIAACYHGLHDFVQARDHYLAFLQKYPTGKLLPDALFGLGRSYFEISRKATNPKTVQANLADAITNYELIRAKFPKSELLSEVTFQLGYLYAYLDPQDTTKSLTSFQEFVKRWPKDRLITEALYQIAHNEIAQSKFEAAIAAYKHLIDKYPNHDLAPTAVHELAAVYRTVGSAMLRQEQFAQARDAFQNSLALYPADVRTETLTQIGLGEACLGLNRLDDAEKTFKQVLTANPKNTDAELGLAKVYLSQGKGLPANAKAVDLLNKVMASATGDNAGEAAFLLGNYFFNLQGNEKENKKTALAYYLRVALLISGPRGEEAAFRNGQCHKVLGNTEVARSAFQSYLRRFPDGKFAADAKQELAAQARQL